MTSHDKDLEPEKRYESRNSSSAGKYLFFVNVAYSFSILRPLQEAIRKRNGKTAWFLHDLDDGHLASDELRLSTVEKVKAYGPKAVFAPGNWVPDFFPGLKVEVFHGFHAHKRPEPRGHFRIRGFFDLYCTHGPSTTLPFKKLSERHRHFEVAETGWPKLDPLFQPSRDAVQEERPVIFLSSTFSPKLSCADALFAVVRKLAASKPWKWVVNFHPLMDARIVSKYKAIQSENLTYVDTADVIPLLRKADIMISDTSSIVTEFLVMHKPVVTFRNRRPGPHLIDVHRTDDLAEAVSVALTKPEHLMAHIRAYVEQEHPYCDGCSSLRVLEATDRLAEKGLAHLKPKPFNLIRRLKARNKLGYYRWR
jgi:hypothetical protein